MSHSHLTLNHRIQIEALLAIQMQQKVIAVKLGVSEAAISKEIKRNGLKDGYNFYHAEQFAQLRRKNSKIKYKTSDPEIVSYIETKLKNEHWSPQQISLRIKIDLGKTICTESVYQIIYKDRELVRYLKRSRKRRKKRSVSHISHGIVNRVSIHERSQAVENRSRVGHWEIDTIIGAGHQGVIASFVERRSRYTIIKKMNDKSAAEMLRVIKEAFEKMPRTKLRTFTSDNGKEFAYHEKVTQKLGVKFYFADPYSPWQRGTNENTNGLIREFLPKKQSLDKVTQAELDYYSFLLNTRPRLCLKGRTPLEVFNFFS